MEDHVEFENGSDRSSNVKKHKLSVFEDSESKQRKLDNKKSSKISKNPPSVESFAVSDKNTLVHPVKKMNKSEKKSKQASGRLAIKLDDNFDECCVEDMFTKGETDISGTNTKTAVKSAKRKLKHGSAELLKDTSQLKISAHLKPETFASSDDSLIAVSGKRSNKKVNVLNDVSVKVKSTTDEGKKTHQQPEKIADTVKLSKKKKTGVLKTAKVIDLPLKTCELKQEVKQLEDVIGSMSAVTSENCHSSKQVKKKREKKDPPFASISSELKQGKQKKGKESKDHDFDREAVLKTTDDLRAVQKTKVKDRSKSKKEDVLREMDNECSAEAFTVVAEKKQKRLKPSKISSEIVEKKPDHVSSIVDSKIEIDTSKSKRKASKEKKSTAKCLASFAENIDLLLTHDDALSVPVELESNSKALKRKAYQVHSKNKESKSEIGSSNCLQGDIETNSVKPAKIRKKKMTDKVDDEDDVTVFSDSVTPVNDKKKKKKSKHKSVDPISSVSASTRPDSTCSTAGDELNHSDSMGVQTHCSISPPCLAKNGETDVMKDKLSKSKKSRKELAVNTLNACVGDENHSGCAEITAVVRVKKPRKHKLLDNCSEAKYDGVVFSEIQSCSAGTVVLPQTTLPVIGKFVHGDACVSNSPENMDLSTSADVKVHKKKKHKSRKVEVSGDSSVIGSIDTEMRDNSSETFSAFDEISHGAKIRINPHGLNKDGNATSSISSPCKISAVEVTKKSRKHKVVDICGDGSTSARIGSKKQGTVSDAMIEVGLSVSTESKAHKKKHKTRCMEVDKVVGDSSTVCNMGEKAQAKSSETFVISGEGLHGAKKPFYENHGKSASSVSRNADDRMVSSSSVDEAESNVVNGCYLGQWATANFEVSERMPKFVRLLGGLKNKTDNAHSAGHAMRIMNGFKSPSTSTAMSATEEKQFNQTLESQFNKALELNLHQKKRVGLGFGPPPEAGKKLYIDKSVVRSKTFDDD